jgi:hypothetical protein
MAGRQWLEVGETLADNRDNTPTPEEHTRPFFNSLSGYCITHGRRQLRRAQTPCGFREGVK